MNLTNLFSSCFYTFSHVFILIKTGPSERIGITNEIFASNDHGMTYLVDYDEENAEHILRDSGEF